MEGGWHGARRNIGRRKMLAIPEEAMVSQHTHLSRLTKMHTLVCAVSCTSILPLYKCKKKGGGAVQSYKGIAQQQWKLIKHSFVPTEDGIHCSHQFLLFSQPNDRCT